MSSFYVEIVNYETDEIATRMGPHTERTAERIEDGANRNLDHEHWFTRIVEEDE